MFLPKLKILVVEDDPNLGAILSEYIEAKGFQIKLCTDGQQGFNAFAKDDFDFCILDIMMPVKDGFTLAKEIRKINRHVPVIFLTAKSMKEDAIEGFRVGADDFITKPFSMEVLLARIQAIMRRSNVVAGDSNNAVFRIGKFSFNYKLRTLNNVNKKRKLTTKENELLKLLCLNLNDVLDRTTALKAVWGDDSYFNSRSMDVYITKLRKYFEEDENVEIVNVHGIGFKLFVNEHVEK